MLSCGSMSPVLAASKQAILQDTYGKGGQNPRVGTFLKQAEPPRAPSPPPQAAACPSGCAEQGGFIQLSSNADAERQHGPSPAGSPVDRHCRCCTKGWAAREGCKSFPGCAAPGIRGACWRVSPTLKPTTHWTGAPLFFLFSFSVFFFPSAQSKSLDSHRTQGILLYRNPFFRQLCQECFHTLGWMGKKRA